MQTTGSTSLHPRLKNPAEPTCTRPSDSVKAITNALRELSKRVGERKGDKVVCKIMWDRGSFKQLYQCVQSFGVVQIAT